MLVLDQTARGEKLEKKKEVASQSEENWYSQKIKANKKFIRTWPKNLLESRNLVLGINLFIKMQ